MKAVNSYLCKKCIVTIISAITLLVTCSACSTYQQGNEAYVNNAPISQSPVEQLPAVQSTIAKQETTYEITVDDMRDGFPYILYNDTIKKLDCVGPYYELCDLIEYEDLERIPKIASEEQLIVRTERNDFDYVVIEAIDISSDEFVNPYIRFYYNYDGQLLLHSEGCIINGKDLEQGNYDVENINLPLWNVYDRYYYLYSNDTPSKYTVGYWEGTQYSEITLGTTHMPFTKISRVECYFMRTRNGYSIVDLSDFESGYYIIRGCSYKKGENGSRGYLVYIE